jgi:hypothetical protein
MFRRRTDQVYSTLQQVQRRITEQTAPPGARADLAASAGDLGLGLPGSVPPPVTASQAPFPAYPSTAPATAPVALSSPSGPTAALGGPAAQRPLAGYPTTADTSYVFQVSGNLAMLLAVLWVVSMAVMFMVGQHLGGRPGAGLAPGDAGHRGDSDLVASQAASSDSVGGPRYVLVLERQLTPTPDNVRRLVDKANQLNAYVRNNPGKGWMPYFAVRQTSAGTAELIFGRVDGHDGIDRGIFAGFARLLSQPQPEGAGYTSATWVAADGS